MTIWGTKRLQQLPHCLSICRLDFWSRCCKHRRTDVQYRYDIYRGIHLFPFLMPSSRARILQRGRKRLCGMWIFSLLVLWILVLSDSKLVDNIWHVLVARQTDGLFGFYWRSGWQKVICCQICQRGQVIPRPTFNLQLNGGWLRVACMFNNVLLLFFFVIFMIRLGLPYNLQYEDFLLLCAGEELRGRILCRLL